MKEIKGRPPTIASAAEVAQMMQGFTGKHIDAIPLKAAADAFGLGALYFAAEVDSGGAFPSCISYTQGAAGDCVYYVTPAGLAVMAAYASMANTGSPQSTMTRAAFESVPDRKPADPQREKATHQTVRAGGKVIGIQARFTRQ